MLFITAFDLAGQTCQLPCNDSLQIEPAYSCEVAAMSAFNGTGPGFVCNLDGYCTSTGDVPTNNPPPPFCGPGCVLNNPIWFSFVGVGDWLDLDICVGTCNGTGMQWALYDQCGNFMSPVACDCANMQPEFLFNISVPIITGTIYYLVLDGYNGSECGLQFKANSGISAISTGGLVSDNLNGPKILSKNKIATYNSMGFHFASDYKWYLDNTMISKDSLTVKINANDFSPGFHQLCLQATNDCSEGIWREKCWDLEIRETSGISSEVASYQFNLLQNPVHDRLLLNRCIDQNQLFINIIDAAGKKILDSQIWNGKEINIDITNLSPGVYFYQILDQHRILHVDKFVKI